MKQKIYTAKQHKITLDQIDKDALSVLRRLYEHGHIAYLVGGSVRDLLLGHAPKDFDISTSATPEEVKKLFRNCILIGRRFRLAHIRFGRKVLEVATFRSGDIESENLIVRDNVWGSEEDDVIRRDFTLNGLYYNPIDETVIDYVDGYADIKKHYLRTIGQPYLRFKQDPVRMIRLIKFQARFDFTIDSNALVAMLECRQEILKSSPARVLEEFLRMLESKASSIFIELLTEHGFTQLILPTLADFLETDEGERAYEYLDYVDENPKYFPRSLLLSALLFPMLEERINTRFLDREQSPNLGEIESEVRKLLRDLFSPFLRLSKKLSHSVIVILLSQYRLTPFREPTKKRKRIPRQPDFFLAIDLLHLRALVDRSLFPIWKEWKHLIKKRVKK